MAEITKKNKINSIKKISGKRAYIILARFVNYLLPKKKNYFYILWKLIYNNVKNNVNFFIQFFYSICK